MATKKTRRKKTGKGVKDLISLKLMKIGSPTEVISMPKDCCVAELLETLGLDESTEVRNGESEILDADDILEDGDQLTIMGGGKIEGGKAEKKEEEDKEEDTDEEEEDKEVGEDEEKKDEKDEE